METAPSYRASSAGVSPGGTTPVPPAVLSRGDAPPVTAGALCAGAHQSCGVPGYGRAAPSKLPAYQESFIDSSRTGWPGVGASMIIPSPTYMATCPMPL